MSDEIEFREHAEIMSERHAKPAETAETGPPPDASYLNFPFIHFEHGKPSAIWHYLDEDTTPLMVVARYETSSGKQVLPWTWHLKDAKWVQKSLPKPRPLFGLWRLPDAPGAPVMLVEGEKKVIAAQEIVGDRYVVISWPGGANGTKAADWQPIYGRKILIWPDADLPGLKAAGDLTDRLKKHCPEIKILSVPLDGSLAKGWDAFDALKEGWDWDRLKAFAADKIHVVHSAPKPAPPAIKAQAVAQAAGAQAGASVEIHLDDGEAVGAKVSHSGEWEKLGIAQTRGGAVTNTENVLRILENKPDFKNLIWFDDFHQKPLTKMNLITWETEDESRMWRDVDTLFLMAYMQRHMGLTKLTEKPVQQALDIYSHANARNEPREWLNSLIWDRKERIEAFFCAAFGVKHSEYALAASKNFWIALVARILRPGCQVDNMIILEGDQGAYKSSALRLIGGQWGKECNDNILNKDFNIGLAGRSLVIINEWDKFRKVDMAYLKDQITTATDNFRPVFGKHHLDHKRTCVFIATTNKHSYLTDETGGRRYWPMRCGKIDKELIASIREQCYAEAVVKFRRGDTWWQMPDGETEIEQEKRRDADDWEGAIEEYLASANEAEIKVLHTELFRVPLGQQTRKDALRIGRCLRALGWECEAENVHGTIKKIFRRKPGRRTIK